jgi:endonuclease-3 related protein
MHFPVAKKPAKQKVRASALDKPPATRSLRAIARFYRSLLREWGPQNWWPAESKFEVIVGAILTQNTSWTNVERAMRNLREAGMLSPEAIQQADCARLESLLRPAGYFRQKTRRLQDLTAFILASYRAGKTSGNGGEHPAIACLLAQPTEKLRSVLLEQKGVGPETADSILLYAGNHPVFVVDTYTRRVFERHQLVAPGADYETIRLLVERALRNLPPESRAEPATTGDRPAVHYPSAISTGSRPELAQRYNEFHALLVQVGKHYCLKKAPNCTNCPLSCFLPASDNAQVERASVR